MNNIRLFKLDTTQENFKISASNIIQLKHKHNHTRVSYKKIIFALNNSLKDYEYPTQMSIKNLGYSSVVVLKK